ncbi:glycosyltransferase family 2 protein [Flavobacterium sp. PLA-1-15]|uniref:glycosyltransferase family 2 protein n=1 Tax=Flavobacterium sp. PLA-1-15 TaxID=3380533 RepID=UPI003B7FB79E
MLSILIPTYNYNTFPLVKELFNQCKKSKIEYEIIVLDDGSENSEIRINNLKINTLDNCNFEVNKFNLGRGPNLNKLVSKAKHPWVLIMDCDTFPSDPFFIKKYLEAISTTKAKVVFGGISYKSEKPADDELLRWVYGKKRESIPLEARKKHPYNHVLTSNILIQKELIEEIPFPDYIKTYGYEDLILVLEFKKNNIEIEHISNPSLHLNLEKSSVFLNKCNIALGNLKYLLDSKIIENEATSLSKLYNSLQKMSVLFLVSFFFKISKKQIIKNLVSKKPSLLLFDFYKLGYFNDLNKMI